MESVEGVVDEVLTRHRVGDLLKPVHALIVFDAICLEFVDQFGFQVIDLSSENGRRALQNRFNQGNDVEGILGRFHVEFWNGLEEIQPECLIHGEVILQINMKFYLGHILSLRSIRRWGDGQHTTSDESTKHGAGTLLNFFLRGLGFVANANDAFQLSAAILFAAAKHIEHEVVPHLKT